jgi:TonB family protein
VRYKVELVAALGVLLGPCTPTRAQETGSSPDQQANVQAERRAGPPGSSNASGFEILDKAKLARETLRRYPERVLYAVRGKWYPNIPRDPQPAAAPSSTEIKFTILRDGSLGGMSLDRSSGVKALDDAAQGSIHSAAPFPALPATWPKESLTFRFHFFYNEEPSPERLLCSGQDASGFFHAGLGLTPPHPVVQSDPEYAEEARRIKYQGTVMLSGTVEPDGSFANVCVKQPAGYHLDEQAIATVKKWKFEPATKDGQPVPVRINVEVSFRIE